jgi:transcriptional regulator with XRE-family HTH domain
MTEVAQQFSENLLILRRRARLSQEELGFLAEVHRTEIGQLERGHRLPRIDTVVKLAGALGVDPVLLLAGMVWVPGEPASGRLVGRYAVTDG